MSMVLSDRKRTASKAPFLRMTVQNPKEIYACINLGEAITLRGLEAQPILFHACETQRTNWSLNHSSDPNSRAIANGHTSPIVHQHPIGVIFQTDIEPLTVYQAAKAIPTV